MTNSRRPLMAQISRIAEFIRKRERFLLLTHNNPDGDALGSTLALGEGLTSLGKHTTIYMEGDISESYVFLPGLEGISSDPGNPEDYDVVVLLDCYNLARVGEHVQGMVNVPDTIILDHHISDEAIPEFGLVDPDAAAAGELVWHLLKDLDVEITPSIATNLFVAISTDTGSFSFSNTTAEALETAASLVRFGASPWDISSRIYLNRSPGRMALLGQVLSRMEYFHQGRMGALTITNEMMNTTGTTSLDTDGFVEYPRAIKGAELAVLFREAGPERIKVSLRSMGHFDAASLARSFGGGGHFQAAGFTMFGPMERVKKTVVEAVGPMLSGDGDGSSNG